MLPVTHPQENSSKCLREKGEENEKEREKFKKEGEIPLSTSSFNGFFFFPKKAIVLYDVKMVAFLVWYVVKNY